MNAGDLYMIRARQRAKMKHEPTDSDALMSCLYKHLFDSLGTDYTLKSLLDQVEFARSVTTS
jgi:hypothetical protein